MKMIIGSKFFWATLIIACALVSVIRFQCSEPEPTITNITQIPGPLPKTEQLVKRELDTNLIHKENDMDSLDRRYNRANPDYEYEGMSDPDWDDEWESFYN